jgi:FtsP/CotA-like multicopper oxidase with cupredoxin domain
VVRAFLFHVLLAALVAGGACTDASTPPEAGVPPEAGILPEAGIPAEAAEPPTDDRERVLRREPPAQMKKVIGHVERQGAAERAMTAGLVPETWHTKAMSMPGMVPRYFTHPNYANSPLPGNVVAEWNAIAQEIVQPAPMPGMPMPMGGTSMVEAFVLLSYVQAAVYNALVAIEGGYEPYESQLVAPPTASRDAAVVEAAYGVLAYHFPLHPLLEMARDAYLAAIPDHAAKSDGVSVGQAAAAEIIALRTGDGRADASVTVPLPGSLDGGWVATMPMPPIDPWMALLTPFLLESPSQFRPAPPPAMDSAEFEAQVADVKRLGGLASTDRTPEQAEIAAFWTANGVIQFNEAYRDVAERRGLNLLDTARLLAMGTMVGSDALVACFDSKYFYNLARPVTVIQATDPDWMPLLPTPNHPEYVAGHDCFAASQAAVFAAALGTDEIDLVLVQPETGVTRHYATAADLRAEVVRARVWGGMHYPMSTALGDALGDAVATYALDNYFARADDLAVHAEVSGGIRKFVDGLPGLGPQTANNLGQYISVAVPDTTTYPGSDYYEIALVQYRERMHSDLPPTLLRGYVQLSTDVVPGAQVELFNELLDGSQVPTGHFGVDQPHYLGATIVAQKNRPVRVKFLNLLPTGSDGDLFLPVDTTVMGSGPGPLMDHHMNLMDPQNPMCGMIPKPYECYTDNRATLHLHGGTSPWISDGTPHQWITPAGQDTPYPQGVSVRPVPDMDDSGDPTDGVMTFYYTNQQSARLMFYHDHAWGITRLNVYAGEAAGYLLTDETEQQLLAEGGPLADVGLGIPLVIQDKTFVPNLAQLMAQDDTWDVERWGGPGSLWVPHVYSPAQNPGDIEGVNPFGRWMYGPWFWPPTNSIDHGPIPNPYCLPEPPADLDAYAAGDWSCDDSPGEGPLIPGTPYNSMGMEAFNDTPTVNGTAYPYLSVEPKAYRFRLLNAANDRFFNLSWYVADPEQPTEVALNAAEVEAALDDPAGVFPTPDEALSPKGPAWVMIGSEGGFLPAPVVIPAQPTTWVVDPTVFNAGNVDQHSLLIAPAERADVIVDFSQYAGQTLILYNDAPAAFPARDPRYDYYTGSPDLTETGGVPTVLPGYGPNIRTIMQIRVAEAVTTPAEVSLTALEDAFRSKSLGGGGVFEDGQHPIIVGQAAYNEAYGTSFRATAPRDGFARIENFSLTFDTLSGVRMTNFPFQPKQIQDEMGEAFDPVYGRMSGFLGVEVPFAEAGLQNMILYPYMFPPSEVLAGVVFPEGVEITPIESADDGTQIWRITHNGVDTHPVHFHLYEVQLVNRVGWDGMIRPPHPTELGWKDTVRVSPLEDTIVALRPLIPRLPWDLPNSIRLLDPSMPEGAWLANTTQAEIDGQPILAFAPNGEPIDVINRYVNFGWEYVWHCHILSHEEMDMMRAQAVGVAPRAPDGLVATRIGNGNNRRVELSWSDNSLNETGFLVERATASDGPWTTFATLPSTTTGPTIGPWAYTDPIGNTNQPFYYRVQALNVVGDTWDYTDPELNEGASFPSLTLHSGFSNVASTLGDPPAAPSDVQATAAPQGQRSARVTLTWVDQSNNETGFTIQRATNADFTVGLVTSTVSAGTTTFVTGNVARDADFYFRVWATNAAGASAIVEATPFPIHTP